MRNWNRPTSSSSSSISHHLLLPPPPLHTNHNPMPSGLPLRFYISGLWIRPRHQHLTFNHLRSLYSTDSSTSISSTPSTRPRPSRLRNPSTKPFLSLDDFLLRQRVLSLYRTVIRACYKVSNPPPSPQLTSTSAS